MKNSIITICCMLTLSSITHAQERFSAWQVEVSLDYMMHGDAYGVQVLYDDASEIIIGNNEKNSFYLAISRLVYLAGRVSFRYGLSLSDKGYWQDYHFVNPNTDVYWRWKIQQNLYYVGVPLMLSFNTLTHRAKLSGFAEVGILPEALIARNKPTEMPVAELIEYNLRPFGLSGTVNAGLQYQLSESLTLIAGPQLRYALLDYDKLSPLPISSIPRVSGYRPFSLGISVGLRF